MSTYNELTVDIKPSYSQSNDLFLPRSISLLKKGIWVYFFLLLFEGALRKWVLPGLASPLLIVRDPVAIWILIKAYNNNILKINGYIVSSLLITLVSVITSVIWGHGNLAVALYGARIMIIHFPFLFVVGSVFNYDDVVKIGKVILILAPLMTILIALQFYSPQSAWINRGIGGNESGGGFNAGAMGYLRPPGTFSFISGLTDFYGLVGGFVISFWIKTPKKINKWQLLIASVSLLAAVPLCISRALFFQIGISLIFAIIACSQKPKYLIRIIIAIIGFISLLILLSNFDFFNTSVTAFTRRFELANENEGGVEGVLGDRFLGGMIRSISNYNTQSSFWGQGLGMGTNVGSTLLTGDTVFLISEGEWGRILGEMGIFMGLLIVFVRNGLVLKMSYYSYKALFKENFLSWLLLSVNILATSQGQWARPSSLGFAVFGAGLVIASLKKR